MTLLTEMDNLGVWQRKWVTLDIIVELNMKLSSVPEAIGIIKMDLHAAVCLG